MSAGWVAGSVRARLLTRRRLGHEGAIEVAASPSLRDALIRLAGTAYVGSEQLGLSLEEAERAVAATTLLQLRMIAGWLPRAGLELMRALGAWFELANIEDRLAYLLGSELRHPFTLGSLAVAWPRVAQAETPGELRAALAASVWGEPGGETPAEVHRGLRLAWARRLFDQVPEESEWIAGALAIFLAREVLQAHRAPDLLQVGHVLPVGPGWERATTPADLAGALPSNARWSLEDVPEIESLWRAEARWWMRIERDATVMARSPREGREVAIGAVALLVADARRVIAALAAAARGARDEFQETHRASA